MSNYLDGATETNKHRLGGHSCKTLYIDLGKHVYWSVTLVFRDRRCALDLSG